MATQNGHILRYLTSLKDSITGSLTFSEKKPSHYALPTNPTLSEKPYPTPPRSANLLETNAPSLTPNYANEEMKCTSSRVAGAITEQYISSTTRFIHDRVREHINNENSSLKKRHIYSCQNEDYKGIEVKITMSEKDRVNLRLYEAFYIRNFKPTLNSREECKEFADLLF